MGDVPTGEGQSYGAAEPGGTAAPQVLVRGGVSSASPSPSAWLWPGPFSLVPDQADGARAAGYSGMGELLPLLFVFNKKSLSCRGWHRVCTKILGLMDQQLPGKPFKPFSVSSILDAFRFLPVKL